MYLSYKINNSITMENKHSNMRKNKQKDMHCFKILNFENGQDSEVDFLFFDFVDTDQQIVYWYFLKYKNVSNLVTSSMKRSSDFYILWTKSNALKDQFYETLADINYSILLFSLSIS